MATRKTKNYKFPNPSSCKPEDQAVLCTGDRLLNLYNQANNSKPAKRIAKKVRIWFASEAKRRGWAGAKFVREIQTSHGAGCILWIPPRKVNVTVKVTNEILVLRPDSTVTGTPASKKRSGV